MPRVAAEDDARQEFTLALDESADEGRADARRRARGGSGLLPGATPRRSGRFGSIARRPQRSRPSPAGRDRRRSDRGRRATGNDRRVDEVTGKRHRFATSILPSYVRRSPKVAEVLPQLYLHGAVLQGLRASARRVLRRRSRPVGGGDHPVTTSWSAEHEGFMVRDLSGVDYVYCWVRRRPLLRALRGRRPGCACWSWRGSAPTGGGSLQTQLRTERLYLGNMERETIRC